MSYLIVPVTWAQGQNEASAIADQLAAKPELQKKVSEAANSSWYSQFSHDHESVVALPDDILFYDNRFAQLVTLTQNLVIPLDPGIEAIHVEFQRVLKLKYDPNNEFIKKYGIDHFTPQQRKILEQNISALPVIFRQEQIKPPLDVHYDCYLTLWLKQKDSRVSNIKLPNQEVWWGTDELINKMLAPIEMYQVKAAQDPDLKKAAHNEQGQLIANYNDYIQKTLNAPRAFLAKSKKDWVNKNQKNISQIKYSAHFLNFFPGMNYLSFQIPYCRILEDSKKSADGIWLFIQKNKTAGNKPKDFSAFQIPLAIVDSPSLEYIKEWNQKK